MSICRIAPKLSSFATTLRVLPSSILQSVEWRGVGGALRECHSPSDANSGNNDWIHINGMRFHGKHGALPEETRLGQTFIVDARLQVDTTRAGVSDALEDTVNYAEVYGDIKGVLEGPPCALLEAVAHRAAAAVLARHARVREIVLGVRKLCIPGLPSVVESVGVEVRRRR